MRALAHGPIAMLVALSVVGCGHRFEVSTPTDFVQLEEDAQQRRGYAMRATTADGVVIAVREIENDRHGSADFWVAAVRNRLRRAGGYALLEEAEVRAASGQAGHQMRFGRDEGGRPYAYWLTLFVTHDRIFVIEAGGRRELMEAQVSELETSLATFRIR